jgi:hypothetical protein
MQRSEILEQIMQMNLKVMPCDYLRNEFVARGITESFSGAAGLIATIKKKTLSRAYSIKTGVDGDIAFSIPKVPESNERVFDSVLETFLNGYVQNFAHMRIFFPLTWSTRTLLSKL